MQTLRSKDPLSKPHFSLPEWIIRVKVGVEKDSDIDADVDTVVREASSMIFFGRAGVKDNERGQLSILSFRHLATRYPLAD